jgi:hypothetical protein
VLTRWRARLRKSEHPQRIFDAVRGRRRHEDSAEQIRRVLYSTLLEVAVPPKDTVTQLIAAVRRVRRVVPGATAVVVVAHGYESPSEPLIATDEPGTKLHSSTEVSHSASDARCSRPQKFTV